VTQLVAYMQEIVRCLLFLNQKPVKTDTQTNRRLRVEIRSLGWPCNNYMYNLLRVGLVYKVPRSISPSIVPVCSSDDELVN